MAEEEKSINPYFFQLVISLQSAAMYQMGKTVSPVTGKIERDMLQAKGSIDLLVMLQEKMKGNLTEEEKQILDSTVYNLQMNYVDEAKNDKSDGEQTTDSDSQETPEENETDSSDNGSSEQSENDKN